MHSVIMKGIKSKRTKSKSKYLMNEGEDNSVKVGKRKSSMRINKMGFDLVEGGLNSSRRSSKFAERSPNNRVVPEIIKIDGEVEQFQDQNGQNFKQKNGVLQPDSHRMSVDYSKGEKQANESDFGGDSVPMPESEKKKSFKITLKENGAFDRKRKSSGAKNASSVMHPTGKQSARFLHEKMLEVIDEPSKGVKSNVEESSLGLKEKTFYQTRTVEGTILPLRELGISDTFTQSLKDNGVSLREVSLFRKDFLSERKSRILLI